VRYDTGNPAEYLKAVVQTAARKPETGADFRAWLTDYVAGADFAGDARAAGEATR